MDPPPSRLDPFVLDSTSDLLADLDLVGGDHHREKMDSMDTNLVFEVPDTPDRVAVLRREEDVHEEAGRKTCYRQPGNLTRRGRGTSSSNAIDNERLFRRAGLAISKSFDAELSPQNRRTRHEQESRIRQEQEQNNFDSSSSSLGEDRSGMRGKVIDMSHKILSGISYPTIPTRCRSDRSKKGNNLCGESEADFNIVLTGVGASPSGPVGRRGSRAENSSEQPDSHCELTDMDAVAEITRAKYNTKINEINGCLLPKSGQAPSRPLQFYASSRNGERCISPYNISKDKSPSVGRDSGVSYGGTNARDKGKGIDMSSISQDQKDQTVQGSSQLGISLKKTGQRSLVRNGYISPMNIARVNSSVNGKKDSIGKLPSDGVSDGVSSSQLHILSPDSELRQSDRMKGKEFLNEAVQKRNEDVKHRSSSNGELLVPGEDAIVTREEMGQPAEEMGWRTTRNRTGKACAASVSKRNDDSSHSSDPCNESVIEDKEYVNVVDNSPKIDFHGETIPSSFSYETNWGRGWGSSHMTLEQDPEGMRQHGAQKLTRGKRKSRSSRTNLSECSSSTSDILNVSFLQSSGEPSHAKSTRTYGNSQWNGISSGSIIDVDDLASSELRCSNSRVENGIASVDSSAKAQQVESDEMLARQLQEQFFNESPVFGDAEEIDASIAWTLQQEEAVQRASSTGSRGQFRMRSPSVAHLYRHHPRQSSQNSSVRSTSRPRMSSSARTAQLRRNVRRDMDLETRLNFLEALEAAFDRTNDPIFLNNIFPAQRDFNENDYEMLLALDDDNHQHMGASVHQINSLPQSVVQTDNFEEACAICLETPSVGDTIRHLPCLHKFHKECIDTWLGRRTSCPICKSGIT